MQTVNIDSLCAVERLALDEALSVLEFAYEPIFHYKVGACLISDTDVLVGGTNFANTAYGSSICAERAAVLRANAMGIKKFKAIVITAKHGEKATMEVTAPCGDCRQFLNEVSDLSNIDLKVILSTTAREKIVVTTIKELLPLAFGPKNLIIDSTKLE